MICHQNEELNHNIKKVNKTLKMWQSSTTVFGNDSNKSKLHSQRN